MVPWEKQQEWLGIGPGRFEKKDKLDSLLFFTVVVWIDIKVSFGFSVPTLLDVKIWERDPVKGRK